jgi:hypothetical protein
VGECTLCKYVHKAKGKDLIKSQGWELLNAGFRLATDFSPL